MKDRHKTSLLIFFTLMIMTISILSCGCLLLEKENAVKVSLESTGNIMLSNETTQPLRMGVFSVASPKATMEYYEGLRNYVSQATGRKVELVQRDNPREISYLLGSGYLDIAFVREDAYYDGAQQFAIDIMAIPIIQGNAYYQSYVIVHSGNGIESITDLQGKNFIFNDFRFTKEKVEPDYIEVLLAEMNKTPSTFFSSYSYSESQDRLIEMLSKKNIDGAEVDNFFWEYMKRNYPQQIFNLTIIDISPAKKVPVLAYNPHISLEEVQLIKNSVISMHRTKEGKQILESMGIDMFIPMDNATYETLEYE
ncbi:PhnD/SsuA/transferrin family substrate-binding protein [uncultured Methanomethylovorans sp.]|uniref:PhnD/SsuA/transferrin family substrate-binding protein n=1 Tax=uncultured Methanomethylovorans sp. TaxID=183759 RepID=UPI002AA7BCEF|nr:PhnD/SsuA/transferrin family substrate-binding protein [uncultured Methanomethylovorans sp.]